MTIRPVLQFKITLQGIHPPIWRRIQVSDLCSFWDLHVAIQKVKSDNPNKRWKQAFERGRACHV